MQGLKGIDPGSGNGDKVMKTAIIILNYNDYAVTIKLLASISSYKSIDKIVIVDNKSTDDSFSILKEYENDKVDVILSDKNGGYAYGNNYGIKHAIEKYDPEYLIISNPDVEFDENIVVEMIKTCNINEHIGIVSPMMVTDYIKKPAPAWKLPSYRDNLAELFIFLRKLSGEPLLYKEKEIDKIFNYVDVLPGSFFIIKRTVLEEIGLFDQGTFLYFEENILGHKLKEKGYRNILRRDIEYKHLYSVSIDKNIKSAVKKFSILYESMDYYNKNYLKINKFQSSIFFVLSKLALLEKYIMVWIRRIINKRKK